MGLRDWFRRSPRKTTEELLVDAREHVAASRFEEALSVYTQIRKRDRTPAILVEMARACLAQEDDQGALSYASDARDAAGTAGPPRDIAAAMCVQGEVLLRERRRSDAMDRFREAIALDPECAPARAAIESENRPASRPIVPEGLVATKSRVSSFATNNEAWARNQLAEIGNRALKLQRQGRLDEALPITEDAVRFAHRHLGEDHSDYATSLNNLATLYHAMGNYAAAEPLLRLARDTRSKAFGATHPDYAASLNNLAAFYRATGDYPAAESLLKQSHDILRKALGADHPDYATSLQNLATLHAAMGDFAAAEPLLKRARDIYLNALGADDPNYATSLFNLAALYDAMGDYAAAEPLYRQARDIRLKALGADHPDYATSLNNLAALYDEMGDYAAAEPLYRQARDTRLKALGADHPDYATSLLNLGVLHRDMGDYTAAEPLLKRARDILGEALGADHTRYATSLKYLGLLYRYMGDYSTAEPLLRQARDIHLKAMGADDPNYATSLNDLAAFYHAMGNYAAAEPLLQQARDIHLKALGDDHPNYANSLINLATLYVTEDRFSDGFQLAIQSSAIEDRLTGAVFSISSERQRVAWLDKIRSTLDQFLSLVRRHLEDSPEAVRHAMELLLRRKAIGAEALATQRDAAMSGKYPHLEPQLRELVALSRQVAQATWASPGVERIEAHRRRLGEWNARKEQLELGLARKIPEMDIQRRIRAADRRAVALGLPEGVALVELIRFLVFDFKAVPARGQAEWKEWCYLAFVLRAGNPDDIDMIELGEAEPIDRMVADFRASLTGPDGRDVTATAAQPIRPIPEAVLATGQALRRAVFDPLVKALGDRPRLLLAPDGDLTRLPFGVLPTDDGRLLIDDYAISYLNTGRDVLRFGAATTGQATRPLVAADPDFDYGSDGAPVPLTSESWSGRRSRDLDGSLPFPINRLDGTRREGEQIARMLGEQPWLAGGVLEGRLKEECHSPRILHVATHGFFLEDQHRELRDYVRRFGLMDRLTDEGQRLLGQVPENPLLRSGLILAGVNTWHRNRRQPLPGIEDGLLTAEDVTGLDLLATELVVLSACDTGLGEVRTGEGVFGLQRAFILAGAKTLVMSLWKVPDHQTQELMVDFYRRLIAGEGKAEALRQAQLAMKAKYPDPYYWGAFVCLGDPGPLTALPSRDESQLP